MNFNKKYLKYKKKYLSIKNQIGGMFNKGDIVRVTGENNIVVENRSGRQNYSDVEGEIIESKLSPNGTRVYYLATKFGYALEVNSAVHNITLNRVPEGQVLRPGLAHLGLNYVFPPPSDPPLQFTSALPPAVAHQPPPDPPKFGLAFAPPPSPPERRRYHIYKVNDIVSVNGEIRLGLFKDQQNLSNTSVYKKIGKIIRADEYSYNIPIYDIQFDDTLSFGVNEDFIKKLTHQEILSRQQALDQQELELERQILERRQQELEQQILAAQQQPWIAAQQQQQPWLQQERPLTEARTKKATINRKDGQGSFTQLREKPNGSNFVSGSVLINGTEVDILEGDKLYPDWQYVRKPDTEVRGWVRKIYLQNPEVERQLTEVGTRKARVYRNDGQADFIKLRETPNQSSKFKPVPDLPNGTIVDILEREELNAEWQYVRFSPYRDTNVSGWVKKIYLQYL